MGIEGGHGSGALGPVRGRRRRRGRQTRSLRSADAGSSDDCSHAGTSAGDVAAGRRRPGIPGASRRRRSMPNGSTGPSCRRWAPGSVATSNNEIGPVQWTTCVVTARDPDVTESFRIPVPAFLRPTAFVGICASGATCEACGPRSNASRMWSRPGPRLGRSTQSVRLLFLALSALLGSWGALGVAVDRPLGGDADY